MEETREKMQNEENQKMMNEKDRRERCGMKKIER